LFANRTTGFVCLAALQNQATNFIVRQAPRKLCLNSESLLCKLPNLRTLTGGLP